jgi:type IV pilus assembly protein PilX
MKSLSTTHSRHVGAAKQRGLVLFFALIALVAMSLAAITLVRSVDTTTLISGNLAFRQAATTSADGGTETAVNTMAAIELANLAKNVFTDTTHAFNVTNAAIGYYSNVGTAPDLMAATTWVNGISSAAVTEATGNGNTYRYIIERMCRTPNVVLTIQNCLFSSAAANKSNMAVPLPSSICEGPGCPKAGQTPLYRVTVRVTGPKNTISYIQAMVY